MMEIEFTQLPALITPFMWPLGRVSGLLLTAPVLGAAIIPLRVKLIVMLVLTMTLASVLPVSVMPLPLGLQAIVLFLKEIIVGSAIGFVLKLAFEAVTMGGQLIALSMGLSYADIIDPHHGGAISAVSQFYTMLISLVFLVMDGHLNLIALLGESFHSLPIDTLIFNSKDALWSLVLGGGQIFAGAIRVALPALTALLITHIGFSLIARAAPAFSLVGVGFSATICVGLLLLWINLGMLPSLILSLIESAFSFIRFLLRAMP